MIANLNEQNQYKLEQINNYESYLEQKVGSIFSSWKKDYYICLEGAVIIFTKNQEAKEVSGYIPILKASDLTSSDERTFQIENEDKTYIFRASDSTEKEKWMNIISKIIKDIRSSKERNNSLTSEDVKLIIKNKKEITSSPDKKNNIDKISSIGKKIARIIKKYGYILNPEQAEADQVLIDKKINNLINIKDPKIKARIHYGFMYKKHKVHDYFQKRWFFIFSSRPLSDIEYIQDDDDLDKKKQKDWLKFDTLYYFKYTNKGEDMENSGGLEMVNSHKILHFEKEEKYFLNLDVGERVYDFYCENKFERDEWFEVLRNSRRTAKEYFLSKTKKPRNIEKLNIYYQKGEKEFIKKMENEKKIVIGNENDITEYDVFEFNQNNFKELILSTIDGCLSNTPIKQDLMKDYTEYMNKEYLETTESFWKRLYNKMEHANILRMSMLLLTFRDELLQLNVDDENFYKNGKELVRIYYKKTYQNILSVIESILKNEREVKGIKSETGELYTQGPSDLFGLLSNTFDLVKENKNKCVYIEILVLFKESIKQYIIGVDTVLMNLDIIVDNEYLIAVANNSFNIINLLNNLIEDMKEMNVLSETEINRHLQNNKLMYIINKISQHAISHFVANFRQEFGNEFKNINFVDLNVEKIMVKTVDIFGNYKPMMSVLVIKKCWNEILKLTIYHYICCLLTTANKKQKSVEDLKNKVEYDTGLLSETYIPVVGPNLTKSTLKIMNDIVEFFDVRSYMISSSCLTFRQYIGKSFTIATMKYLIKLRSDFTSQEKDEAIEQCKDLLANYQEQDDPNTGGYFRYMEKELKKQERNEKRQERILNSKNSLNDNQSLGRDSLIYSKTLINFNQEVEEEESESESEEEKEEEKGVADLEDFLKEDSEDEDEKDAKKNNEIDKLEINVVDSKEFKEISDIEHEGFMYKKSHTKWQKRFFQLKNGYLYWYLDKKSSIIQNKISIKETEKVESHKDRKFMMRVKETDEKGKAILKVYKFQCESEEEKVAWIFAITNSMKKVKNSQISKNSQKTTIKLRKKIIHDLFDLPDISQNITHMKKQVLVSMKDETYFKPSPRKIEADRQKAIKEEEERKRKEKEEIERKKREEKEERERKKREERERKIKEQEELDKQLEKDYKEGKDVGVKNRIKFWFKGLGKGKEEEKIETKENNNITENDKNNVNENKDNNTNINNINLDDFMNEEEEDEKSENNKNNINNKNESKKEDNNKDNNINESNNGKVVNEMKLEDLSLDSEEESIKENDKGNKIDKIDKMDKNINKEENKNNSINNNENKNENIIIENNQNIDTKKDDKDIANNKIINNNNKVDEDIINNNPNINNQEEKIEINEKEKEEKIEINQKRKEKEEEKKLNLNDEEEEEKKEKEELNNIKIKDNKNKKIKSLESDSEEEESEESKDDEIGRQIKNIEQKNKEENEKDENIKLNFDEEEEDIDKKIVTEGSVGVNSNKNLLKENLEEKKEEKKEKKKKGFFASLFSCNRTNEERNERRKKKKDKKKKESIKDEIKRIKKEQEEIKQQKIILEKENKKIKETQIRLNKKKLTRIEEKSFDDEDSMNNEKKEEQEENKIIEETNEKENNNSEEDDSEDSQKIKNKKIRMIDISDDEDIKEDDNKNNKNDESSDDSEKEEKENNVTKEEENIKQKNEIEENNIEEKNKNKEEGIKNDLNDIKILKNKKRKKIFKKKSYIEEDKISEKSNESDDEEKKEEKPTTTEEENDIKSNNITNITNINNYSKHNNSQLIDESLFKDKKSFNRYSDYKSNGTFNFSNIENREEESSNNNLVNFLGSKDNFSKNKYTDKNMIEEEEEDEMDYLNKKIKKKSIKSRDGNVIEIIPEKKEEESDSDEVIEKRLPPKKFEPRNSSVQFAQAKNILRRSSHGLKMNKEYKKYPENMSHKLIDETIKAEKMIKVINDEKSKNKLDEKIKKIRNEIPKIKTKYEIYLEEEKKKNGGKDLFEEENKNNSDNDDNDEKVNDWFAGIVI